MTDTLTIRQKAASALSALIVAAFFIGTAAGPAIVAPTPIDTVQVA